MGQIHKIGDEYYIEFTARGLLYQQKAGKDEAAAQAFLQEIEAKIQKGEAMTMVRDVDVDIFFKTFLEFAVKEYTPKTSKRFQKAIEHFNVFLNTKFPDLKKLSEVTPKIIEHYRLFLIKTEHLKPRTINFTLLLLRDILEYGIKLGYINDNPAVHVRFVPELQRNNLKVLHDGKVEQILNDPVRSKEIQKARGILRNSFAKGLLDRGVPLFKLNKILGLTDITQVMRYWEWTQRSLGHKASGSSNFSK